VRYWWVNQNQTFRHELAGGYLWSPKRNANGARNPFYETMREVSPGDAIFSFVDTRIAAIGIAQSYCWESPKPVEFGEAGQNWENVGWKVKVAFTTLVNNVRPKDHMEVLRALLPSRYSPLQPNGNGIQSIYLTELPPPFAEVLVGLIGQEAQRLTSAVEVAATAEDDRINTGDDLDVWEHRLEERVAGDISMADTDREAIIRARRGQGLFKQRVMEIERRCRITAVENPIHVVASDSKPWRDSPNEKGSAVRSIAHGGRSGEADLSASNFVPWLQYSILDGLPGFVREAAGGVHAFDQEHIGAVIFPEEYHLHGREFPVVADVTMADRGVAELFAPLRPVFTPPSLI